MRGNKRGASNGAIVSLLQFEHQRRAVSDNGPWGQALAQ
jgi:hypothetical protein